MSKRGYAYLIYATFFFGAPARASYQQLVTAIIVNCARLLGHRVTPVAVEPKFAKADAAKKMNLTAWLKMYEETPGRKFYMTKDSLGLLNIIDDRELSMRDRLSRAAYALVSTWRSGATEFDVVARPSGRQCITLTDMPESSATQVFVKAYFSDLMPVGADSFAGLDPPLTAAERRRLVNWLNVKKFAILKDGVGPVTNWVIPDLPPNSPHDFPELARRLLDTPEFAHFSPIAPWPSDKSVTSYRGTHGAEGDIISYKNTKDSLYYRFGDQHEVSFSKLALATILLHRRLGEPHLYGPRLNYAGNYFWVQLPVSYRSVEFMKIISNPKLTDPFAALKNLSPPMTSQERQEIRAWFAQDDGENGMKAIVSEHRLKFDEIIPPAGN